MATTKPTAQEDTSSEAQTTYDIRAQQERDRVTAAQKRYDARVSGKSSAEVNADEAAETAKKSPPEKGLPKGGQTFGDEELPTATTATTTPQTITSSSSSSGSGS